MRHSVTVGTETDFINCQQMEEGDIGVIVHPDYYAGDVLLRTYNQFVILNDPCETWGKDASALQVLKLPKGVKITLTVGGGE